MLIRAFLTASVAFAAAGILRADPPVDAEARAKIIGQPTEIVAQPTTITLNGPRATTQVVVTGKYADGTVRDLTPLADYSADGNVAKVESEGFVTPVADGNSEITVKAGDKSTK